MKDTRPLRPQRLWSRLLVKIAVATILACTVLLPTASQAARASLGGRNNGANGSRSQTRLSGPRRLHVDFAIVGAGPAGLQLAYHFQRQGGDAVRYVVLEREAQPGSFYKRFPVHRKLISLNKRGTGSDHPDFNLRHDWNSLLVDEDDRRGPLRFTSYSNDTFPHADAMVDYLADYARKYELNIEYHTRVKHIRRLSSAGSHQQPLFELQCVDPDSGKDSLAVRAAVVIMATGASRPSYPRSAPGIHYTIGYEEFRPATAGQDYLNKRVLILGTGNSAFEIANNISGVANIVEMCSRNPPKFAWHTHYAGHLRSVNAEFLDTYQLKSQHFISTCVVSDQTAVIRHNDGTLEFQAPFTPDASGEQQDREATRRKTYSGRSGLRTHAANAATYDVIIRALGFEMSSDMFDETTRPQMDPRGKYPLLTPSYESVNVPGLYFAGTLMAGRDAQRSSVFATHGFRYATRALHRILLAEHKQQVWPSRLVQHRADELAAAIVDRVQHSSALYQMFSTMCELFVFDRNVTGDATKGRAEKKIGQHEEASKAWQPFWRHLSEVPCDYVFSDVGLEDQTFMVVTLEYHPDFGKTEHAFNTFGPNRVDPTLHPDEGYKSNFIHPVVRYFTGLNFDGSINTHDNPIDSEAAEDSVPVTHWQGHHRPTPAVATHHMMESVLIDFSHPEAHIEPLLRFLAGLMAVRPELQQKPASSPVFSFLPRRLQPYQDEAGADDGKERFYSLHPQSWLAKALAMPEEQVASARNRLRRELRQGQGGHASGDDDHVQWSVPTVVRGFEQPFIDDLGNSVSPDEYANIISGNGGEGGSGGGDMRTTLQNGDRFRNDLDLEEEDWSAVEDDYDEDEGAQQEEQDDQEEDDQEEQEAAYDEEQVAVAQEAVERMREMVHEAGLEDMVFGSSGGDGHADRADDADEAAARNEEDDSGQGQDQETESLAQTHDTDTGAVRKDPSSGRLQSATTSAVPDFVHQMVRLGERLGIDLSEMAQMSPEQLGAIHALMPGDTSGDVHRLAEQMQEAHELLDMLDQMEAKMVSMGQAEAFKRVKDSKLDALKGQLSSLRETMLEKRRLDVGEADRGASHGQASHQRSNKGTKSSSSNRKRGGGSRRRRHRGNNISGGDKDEL